MDKTKDEQGYNGWSNYETWVTKLWMDNDSSTYEFYRNLTTWARDLAPKSSQVKEGTWTVKEAEKFLLTDAVKENIEDEMGEEIGRGCLATDLLNASISDINFVEIAENLLSD